MAGAIFQALVPVPRGKVSLFASSNFNNADQTVYTFTAQSLGSYPAPDRYIIVGVGNSNTNGISGVTLGGSAMTSLVAAGSGMRASLWILAFPLGTTADIVVTASAGVNRCDIGVWFATGLPNATPVGTASTATLATPTACTTVAGGFLIAMFHPDAGTPAWTNANVDFTDTLESSVPASGASVATTSASTTITAASPGAGGSALVIASF